MKITALKQQVKNPGRVSIFVDEKYSFSLSLDEIVSTKIKNGDELSEADVKKLKKISTDGKLRARALEWLINRPHSERELRDYLRRKNADQDLTESFVSEFTIRGYLNNESYAKWLIDVRSRGGKSARAIRSELFSKGVGREVIEELMGGGEEEKQRLKTIIDKKRKLSRYKNDDLKLAKYLTSQGFSYELVKDFLNTKSI